MIRDSCVELDLYRHHNAMASDPVDCNLCVTILQLALLYFLAPTPSGPCLLLAIPSLLASRIPTFSPFQFFKLFRKGGEGLDKGLFCAPVQVFRPVCDNV